MDHFFLILKLAISILVILGSANYLVKISRALAEKFRLSPLFVSLTVLAIGTSLPELAVSVVSITQYDSSLAYGNIIGSNIVNSTLIFSLVILRNSIRIGTTKTQKNNWILLAVSACFLILFSANFFPLRSTLLLSSVVGIFFFQYLSAMYGRVHEDKQMIKHSVLLSKKHHTFSLPVLMAMFIVCTGTLIFGGELIVQSVKEMATLFDISTAVLGLTLTAFATSLPELTTSLAAQQQHEEKIALGNIMGSNIYNLALIGGILSLSSESFSMPFEEKIFFVASTLFFFLTVAKWKGKVIPKIVGVCGLALYGVFITMLFS